MKNNTKNKLKSVIVNATAKSLVTIADIYAGMACNGSWYEPKMPDKLKK